MGFDMESVRKSIDLDIDIVPEAMLAAHTESGRIVKVNSSTEDLFNCDEEYLIGKNQWDLHPSNKIGMYREAFKRGVEGERVDRLENGEPLFIVTKNDVRVPVEINVKLVEFDGEDFIIGSFRDSTAHIRRELESKSAEDRLRTLLNSLPIPVTIYNSNGEIIIWNEECADTLDYRSEVVIGEDYSFFSDSREYDDLIQRSIEGEVFDGYETSVKAGDGQRIPVELYTEPVYENGDLDSLIAISFDISERKQHERQLNVLQRVLRHNLRNKITVIKGWTDKIKKDGCTPESVSKVDDASDSLIELTEQVQDIRSTINRRDDENISVSVQDFSSKVDYDNLNVSYDLDDNESVASRGLMSLQYLADRCSTNVDETVSVSFRSDSSCVYIDVESDSQLLHSSEISYLSDGAETPLDHADDLRIAHVYILIKSVGGSVMSIDENCLSVELPRIVRSE